MSGENWIPYQAANVVTPGFPEYVSGHSTFSGAGMAILHRHRARFGCLDLQTGASAHGRDLARAGLAAALAAGSVPAVHRWS